MSPLRPGIAATFVSNILVMETNHTLARNLVYQRKLKGLSQKDLSEKTNVTVRTIQRIENGETEPHLQTIKLLSAALEIEVEELFPLENPKEENIQRKWLLLMHATPFAGFILPLFNILVPLFLWIHKREDNPVYDYHGRKVINFQITMSLLFALAFVSLVTIAGLGFLLFISVIPFAVIVMLFNIFRVVNDKKPYYPLSIRFLKISGSVKSKITAVALLLFGICTQANAQNIERLDGSTISSDSLSAEIKYLMDVADVTGMEVRVFNNKQVAYSQAFGLKNKETGEKLTDTTNMYGASLSKAVFAVIAMKLVEDGVIDLDTPLESYLPKKIWQYKPQTKWHDDYSDLKNDSLYHKITARMCLTHTSGFPNWRFFEPDQKLRVKQEPGSDYLYSGEGMVYLQVVLEKITGKNLEDLAQEILFKPLHMNHTAYEWKPQFEKDYASGHDKAGKIYPKDKDNEPRSASTLETTQADYNKFLTAVLNHKILNEKSWDELFSQQIRIRTKRQFGSLSKEKSAEYDSIKLGYALGWGYFETPYGKAVFKEGHGSGFQHYSVLFPDAGKGILIMTNSDNGELVFKKILETALQDIYTPWKWENYIPYDYKKL